MDNTFLSDYMDKTVLGNMRIRARTKLQREALRVKQNFEHGPCYIPASTLAEYLFHLLCGIDVYNYEEQSRIKSDQKITKNSSANFSKFWSNFEFCLTLNTIIGAETFRRQLIIVETESQALALGFNNLAHAKTYLARLVFEVPLVGLSDKNVVVKGSRSFETDPIPWIPEEWSRETKPFKKLEWWPNWAG